MKKIILCFLIGVISFFSFILIQKYLRLPFISPCSTYLIISHKQDQFNLLIDFVSTNKNGTGVVTISGTYFEQDKKVGVMRRLINYNWELHNHIYNLTATDIRISTRDESLSEAQLAAMLPSFFTRNGGKIDLTINDAGRAGYLFSTGIRPLFFCERMR